VFDTFELAAAARITSITFVVAVTPFVPEYYPVDVDVSFWTVGSDRLPGTQLFAQNFAPASWTNVVENTFWTAQQDSYKSAVITVRPTAPPTLGPGTYDISLYNPVSLSIPGFADPSGLMYQQNGQGFIVFPRTVGFSLDSDSVVPIPAALPLFITGAGVIGLLGWRRKRRT
jgi:hypothetical protein